MFNLLTDRGGLPRPVSRASPLPSLCPVAMSNTAAEERESRRLLLLLLLLLAELRRARKTLRPRGGEGPGRPSEDAADKRSQTRQQTLHIKEMTK